MIYQEKLRKKLIYRSKKCGIKENDLILGEYAESELCKLNDTELALYEDLLNEGDLNVFDWITNKNKCPSKYIDILDKIKKFKVKNWKV